MNLSVTVFLVTVPTKRESQQTQPICPSHCASGRCVDFSSPTLDEFWNNVHGNPMGGPPSCKLLLPCFPSKSEIQSEGEMLFGTLAFQNTQSTIWNEFPPTDTDIYFGWQKFEGNCHSAIVVDDGTLAIISPTPGSNCAGGAPATQECYLPIPGWDLGRYNGPHTYVLNWTAKQAILSIDGRQVISASKGNCPMDPPSTPMKVDLSCNLDGVLRGNHFLEVEAIVAIGRTNPFTRSRGN